MSTKTAPKSAAPKGDSSLFSQLDELSAWLNKSKLEEVEIESNGLRMRLKKPGVGGTFVSAPAAASTPAAPAAAAPAANDAANTFTSPLVGTFYAANNPDAPPLVTVGMAVKEGQVLGIVEAMKTMNQITSDRAGTVQKVLVKNASPVEFGQPLFVIA